MISAFFVYGTLKQGRLRSGMWPHAPQEVVPAYTRGHLFDLGSYPGLTEGEDLVLGELWRIDPSHLEETIRVLDQVEDYVPGRSDNEYQRIIIEVERLDRRDSSEPNVKSAYVYRASNLSRIGHARRISPWSQHHGKLFAAWPDSQSRVPTRFEDE